MNKKILTGVLVFIGLIGSGMVYLASQPGDKPEADRQETVSQPSSQSQAQTPSTQAAPGQFIDYNEAAFANTTGDRILFFHAPWCFQCRELEKDIKANLSQIPAGTTIFKIDYDSNQELRRTYDVKLQTSFVKFDSSGKAIKNFVAYDEPTFANLQKNIF